MLFLAPSAWAVSVYALTNNNGLLLVDADVPAIVSSARPITGLDAGDELVGIDVRPATGALYALALDGSLYTIDPLTAAATKATDISVAPSGTNFGIDFNPVVDRLRVVSNTGQNLRVNVGTGVATVDTPLAYAPSPDRNAGATPNVGDVAYANNFDGAATTTLFAIDDSTFEIVTQNPPNNGTLNSPVDPAPHFGSPLAKHAGFDIAPDGTAYIVGVHPTEYVLVVANLSAGTADSHGPIGDGTIPIRDIAVAPTISFSAEAYAISEDGGSATITVKRQGFVNVAASVDYTTHSDSASAGVDYTTTSGTLSFPTKTVTTSADTSQTLTFQVPVLADSFPEGDEFLDLFLTRLATGPGVIGFPDVATLRINANDRPDVLGPRIEFVGLTGPSRAISGAVVHFDEDMDPVTVVNLANYKLSAFDSTGNRTNMAFTSAVYDPVGRKVTLGLAPFGQTAFTRMGLRVRGRTGGVTDLAGNLLDGDRDRIPGGDMVQIFEVFSGTKLKYIDRDGDRVKIWITGLDPTPGADTRLDGVRPVNGPKTQLTQFWILDPIALVSTVNGSIRRSPTGDGIVVISEIIGLDKKEFTPISANPAFRINRLTFSSNATGTR